VRAFALVALVALAPAAALVHAERSRVTCPQVELVPPGSEPAWSRDGRSIAFSSSRRFDAPADLFVVGSDGRRARRLTRTRVSEGQPTWSPYGGRIAFSSGVPGKRDIYVMKANGSGVVRLTTYPGEDAAPSWSPDGTLIAFLSTRDGVRAEGSPFAVPQLYVMRADGREQRRLIADTNAATDPAWSPDGKEIAFVGSEGLMVAQADGSSTRRVFEFPFDVSEPSWSPDGKLLAFGSADEEAEDQVYVAPSHGGRAKRVTRFFGEATAPSWSPRGGAIAFSGGGVLMLVQPDGQHQRGLGFESRVTRKTKDSANPFPILYGRPWNDLICGGDQRDYVEANDGDDVVFGGGGRDFIGGSLGRDRITPGPGRDVVFGGQHDDTIDARDGEVDTIECGFGRDVVRADPSDRIASDCEEVSRR